MDSNLPQSNLTGPKPPFFVANPHLKSLLLVLMVVLILSGLGLVALSQWQASYRQKIYEQTVAGLPKHKAGSTATSTEAVPNNVPAGFKEYSGHTAYGEKYQFSVLYPESWTLSEMRGAPALVKGQCIIALGAGGQGMEGYPQPKVESVVVDGVNAATQTWTQPGSETVIVNTQVVKGNDDYAFNLIYPASQSSCLTDYNRILQTVRINSK